MTAPLDYAAPDLPAGEIRWRPRLSISILLACLYAPYAWLLLIDYPWNDYRLFWLKLWPALPGIVSVLAGTRFTAIGEGVVMAVVSAVLVAAILFPFRRPRRRRTVWIVGAIVLTLSSLNSLFAYVIFRS